ncbi:hypothetical protein AGMMS49938_06600 [Fibrobacterales bacterium]|nr:hypothetical protein AGMMS49938_06600 [Fibrobacterales bacterium]
MAGMTVGGLASGLDTNSIISQLTALEQAKVTREAAKKTSAENTLTKFKELETKLGNLAQKANALDTMNGFNVFKALSNDEEHASISGAEGANAGEYEVQVNQLATTQKVASKSFAAVNTAIGGVPSTGTTITLSLSAAAQKADPLKKGVDVKINENDSLKDVVNKINAAEGSGVRASIMSMSNGDNRLVLTAVDTGTNGFSIKESTGNNFLGASGLGIIDNTSTDSRVTTGNALVTIDGKAANNDTTFDKLNTELGKNNLTTSSQLRITLPTNDGSGSPGAVNVALHNGTSYKTIGDVLTDINNQLAGAGAAFTASVNSSGEIVIEGNLADDQNFGGDAIKNVKIQLGDYNGGNFTVKKDMGSLTSRNIFSNVISEGKNAFYTIDGMAFSSQSNSDDKSITGTTFTLKKVTENDDVVKLSLSLDRSKLASNINAFVEEFNALLKFIDENQAAKVEDKVDEKGNKGKVRTIGAFTGDSAVNMLKDNLKSMFSGTINELTGRMNNGYSTIYSSMSRVGITAGKDGYYSIDSEKLDKALIGDFEGVRRLFTSNSFSDTPGFSAEKYNEFAKTGVFEINAAEGTVNGKPTSGVGNILNWEDKSSNYLTRVGTISFETPGSGSATVTFVRGIAAQISSFVEQAKKGSDSLFKKTEETYQNRIDEIQKRVDTVQQRVNNYTTRLTSQFNALERSIGTLQAQMSNMSAALSR